MSNPTRGRALVVSGPSGSGKSTICRRLRQDPSVVFSVSATTRPIRAGEIDGVHYRFVDAAHFRAEAARGRFLEWAEVHGNLYGSPLEPYERAIADGKVFLLEIDVQGAAQLRAKGIDASYVFIDVPDERELRRRLEGRGTDSAAVVEKRLAKAQAERAHRHEYDHVVVNDDAERAYREVCRLAGLAPRPDTQEGPA